MNLRGLELEVKVMPSPLLFTWDTEAERGGDLQEPGQEAGLLTPQGPAPLLLPTKPSQWDPEPGWELGQALSRGH
jgi:hypothetical protein